MEYNLQKLIPCLFLSSMLGFSTTSIAQDSAIVVFDGSGSMKKKMDGKPKFEIAQEVMGNLVKDWNEDIKLGLMVYGHRSKACDDIEMVIPIGTVNPDQFTDAIKKIQPKGETPIAESLKQAAEKLNYIESPTTVILISDGEESCHADPCAMAKELEKNGINFTAHVIGFDVSGTKQEKAQEQLKCVAKETGGKFFEAKDSEELKTALAETAKVVAEIESASKPDPVSNIKVVSVKSHGIDEPLAIKLETTYKITLKKNEESYFQLSKPVSGGQVFLDMHNPKNKENNFYNSLSILDEDGAVIGKNLIRSSGGASEIGYREKESFSFEKNKNIGFKVLNTGYDAIFWFTILENNNTKNIPFFGKIIPKPLTLGRKVSGVLSKYEYSYYAIPLTAGNYKAILDFSDSENKNNDMYGYLAILNPDGSKQNNIINFSGDNRSIRKASTMSIEQDGIYIFRIENKNRSVNYKLKIRKK